MAVNIDRTRFIRLDYEILAARSLHIWERVVLALIAGFNNAGKPAYFNPSYLEWAGLDAVDLARILNNLEQRGLIYADSEQRLHIPSQTILYEQLKIYREKPIQRREQK